MPCSVTQRHAASCNIRGRYLKRQPGQHMVSPMSLDEADGQRAPSRLGIASQARRAVAIPPPLCYHAERTFICPYEERPMPTKFDTRKKDLLLSDERHERLKPAELLRSLGLRAGQTLADIGCGPGFFTVPAAR